MAKSHSESQSVGPSAVNGHAGSPLPSRTTSPGTPRRSNSGFSMSKGDGADSYSRNSVSHNKVLDNTIVPHLNEALKLVSLPSSGAIRIADLGCSSGPNAIAYVGRIVETLRERLPNSISPQPEFQVYFNDLPSNDFNNLFQLSSSEDINKYFRAGVPGSFYGRLFPKSAVHVFFSVFSVHYLSKVPDAVYDTTSPAFNKGSWLLDYDCNPAAIAASKEQASLDLKNFLHARAVELAPGGLLCFVGGMRTNDKQYCGIDDPDPIRHIFFSMKEALRMLAAKGIITEDEIDHVNFPYFERSIEEVREDVSSFNSAYKVEILEALEIQPFKHFRLDTPTQTKETLKKVCGLMKGIMGEFVKQHLGQERTELFWECCEPSVETHVLPHLSGKSQMFFVALTRNASKEE